MSDDVLTIDMATDRRVLQPSDVMTFGRAADLVVDESNPYLHRIVGRFFWQNGTWWLENLGSFVELEVVPEGPGMPTRLPAGGQQGGPVVQALEPRFRVRFESAEKSYEITGTIGAAPGVGGGLPADFGPPTEAAPSPGFAAPEEPAPGGFAAPEDLPAPGAFAAPGLFGPSDAAPSNGEGPDGGLPMPDFQAALDSLAGQGPSPEPADPPSSPGEPPSPFSAASADADSRERGPFDGLGPGPLGPSPFGADQAEPERSAPGAFAPEPPPSFAGGEYTGSDFSEPERRRAAPPDEHGRPEWLDAVPPPPAGRSGFGVDRNGGSPEPPPFSNGGDGPPPVPSPDWAPPPPPFAGAGPDGRDAPPPPAEPEPWPPEQVPAAWSSTFGSPGPDLPPAPPEAESRLPARPGFEPGEAAAEVPSPDWAPPPPPFGGATDAGAVPSAFGEPGSPEPFSPGSPSVGSWAPAPGGAPDGRMGAVDLAPGERRLLVMLAEPLLRDPGAGVDSLLPESYLAERLGWPVAKLNRKLDYLCSRLTKMGVGGLYGPGARGMLSDDRRWRLAEHAVTAGLVTPADLDG